MKIKKITFCFVVVLCCLATTLHAVKIAELPELMKPQSFSIGNDRIYITEGTSIYIYSQADFRLIKKFGKPGEGPLEFKLNPFGVPLVASPYRDKIYVSSDAKVSIFSRDGEFIKEYKVLPFLVFTPFLDRFLATTNTANEKKESILAVALYNNKFEKEKELYISDMKVGRSFSLDYPINSFAFTGYKDKIYVVIGKEGFVIDVFDKAGSKLYRVKKNYEPAAVTAEYKKKTLDWFQSNPNFKQYWEFFKNRISFKSKCPAIQDITVTDDRIYVLTYKKEAGNTECIIMDLKGKEQKRVFVPINEMIGMDFYPKYGFYNRAFYKLVENEEEEVWELHKIDLK